MRRIEMAAGVTPGMRLACPSERGDSRESFSITSRERPGSEYDIPCGIDTSSS
jgi:hypothetical protein